MKFILLIILSFSFGLNCYALENLGTEKLLKNFNAAYSKFDKKYKESNEIIIDFKLITPSIRDIVNYYFLNDDTSLLVKVVNITESTDKTGSVPMIISKELLKYINNTKVTIKQKQDVLCFLLKYQVMTNKLSIGLIPILNNFYSAHLYNARARKEIKKKLLKDNLTPARYLFLLDAADMYKDKAVMSYLQKESSNCSQWDRDSKWFSLLLLAKHGDEKSRNKLIKIAQIPCAISNQRKNQIFYMPLQLAIIPDERVTSILQDFLASKEEYRSSYFIYSLSKKAEQALHVSLVSGRVK